MPASKLLTEKLAPKLVVEEQVALLDQGKIPLPAAWASRALYLSEAGAQNWLNVVGESTYPLRDANYFNLRANRLEAIQEQRPMTFVSLGPGDGLHDVDLITSLQEFSTRAFEKGERKPTLKYIPVEISRVLLELTIRNVQAHVEVQVGVLCDFEDGQEFLANTLAQFAQPPILFSLLGGTVGNLDGGEDPFFAGFRGLMKAGDAFLLDLPLAGPGWSAAEEPRLRPAGYTNAFRRFLGATVAQQNPADTRDFQVRVEEVAAAFAERIQLSHRHDSQTGAEIITVKNRRSQRTVLTFRRYCWASMLRWLQDRGFTVAFAKCSISANQDKFGMGVVLLTIA